MEAQRSLGQAVRVARVARGLRQIDLARLLGISTSTLSLIENGLRALHPDEALQIVHFLDHPDKQPKDEAAG